MLLSRLGEGWWQPQLGSYLGWSLFISPIILLLAYVNYQRKFSNLAHIDGPFWASLTEAWKLLAFSKGDYHHRVLELHRKYGKIVRIAPNEVIISDASAIREIYGIVDGKECLKTTYYDAFTPFRPTIFSQRDPHLHSQRKRIVSQGYSMSAVQSMEKFVQGRLQLLLDKMAGFANSDADVDLGKWCHFFAFDVIGELAFSDGFGMLESGVEDEHISLIKKHFIFSSTIGNMPSLLRFTKWTFLPIPWLKTLHAGRLRLQELCRVRVEQRAEKGGDRKDLLGRLMEAKDPNTGEKLDQLDLRIEAFSAIVAGSDTTSAAAAYTFYHVLNHPDIYDKLAQELRDAFPHKQYENHDDLPTYADLGKLCYLQACIKESLRLNPPTTVNLPRYVPEGGKIIAGTFFPAKTIVGMAALPLHLNPEYFGSDADKFNPDRWIHSPGGISVEEMTKSWIPFGHGTRQCIGKNVAMMELVKLIGTSFLYFDIKMIKRKPGQQEIPESTSHFVSRLKEPLEVSIRIRK